MSSPRRICSPTGASPPKEVSPVPAWLATGRIAGIPVVVLATIALTALAVVVLHHTVFDRVLSAVGQNQRAAELSGLPAGKVIAITFLTSGAAGLTGVLLSARAGGTVLDMVIPFLLQSVGAVVLSSNGSEATITATP